MTNAKHPIPQSPDREFGAVDEGERLRIDGGAVGETGGKAGGGGLFGAWYPQRPCELAHLLLAYTCLEQGVTNTVFSRGRKAGTPVTEIVRVGAREERGEAAAGGERAQVLVELCLAVIAAIAPVRDVPRPLEFVCRDHLMSDADHAGNLAGPVQLTRREGW